MLIRHAAHSDLPAMARVRVETWRFAYAGIVPDEYLAELSAEHTAKRWRALLDAPQPGSAVFVAEVQGEVAGYAFCGPHEEDETGSQGMVYALYILPAYQRRGIGRMLMRASAEHLQTQGMRSLTVWVLKDNPCRRFYESLGGALVSEKEIVIGGANLLEVAYTWDERRLQI